MTVDSGFVAALGRRPQVPTLRAAAITVLLALAGLSLLIATLPISGARPMRLALILAVASAALLATYLAVWSSTAVGAGHSTLAAISLAASTTPGALEVARLALAVLALWALALAKRPGLAALFSGVAVLITGASGHPAVTQPLIAIPAKSVHLAAAALWLGGLLWIMTAERHGARYVEGTRRISSLALMSVIAVVATGVLQGFLFLPRLAALTDSTYGRLILIKAAGLVVLVFFGAFHRRIVPRLDTTIARRRLRGSVRLEIVVMLAVSVAGGLLAAIAPPR
jgi:copper transport protein